MLFTALVLVSACGGGGGSDWGPVSVKPQLVSGDHHPCALHDDGTLKCWGWNGWGQLGQGDMRNRGDGLGEMGAHLPVISLGGDVKQVAGGGDHTCALLTTGAVKCWGGGPQGQLGLGDTNSQGDQDGEMGAALPAVDLGSGRKATAVAAGEFHSCAILDNGQVKCWGDNEHGELGVGDTENRGDNPHEMGNNLDAVKLGTGRTAKAITVGAYHTCALLDNSQMKCWGWGGLGQLGLGDSASHGDGTGAMGDALPAVDLGTGRSARQITAGNRHTCALLDDGTVKCWGYAWYGQIGTGDQVNRGDGAAEMGDALHPVDLGTGRTAVAVRAEFNTTCAVLDDGSLKCWGANDAGQLGLGDTNNRGDGAAEMGDNLDAIDVGSGRTVVAVAPGFMHTCARLDDGAVKCWGNATHGQLGLGDTTTRGDGAGEMGDALPAVDLGW
jgi:alpha-tubulin suppressor-like RCC1 family protein